MVDTARSLLGNFRRAFAEAHRSDIFLIGEHWHRRTARDRHFDFLYFGAIREGGRRFSLMEPASVSGFDVAAGSTHFADEGAEVISSSRIRPLLKAGDVAGAAAGCSDTGSPSRRK